MATANWLGIHNRPLAEALGPGNVPFIKDTVEFCASDCHTPADISFLPTRLLDVGADSSSHPRLIKTAESITAPIQYATLIYCWGDKVDAAAQTKTELSNPPGRLRAIPTSSM
ncbi:hypothetical protein N657DRAFT_673885 [Parathielavia appendiculata]|uniref:Heterokaryon incompatibility domain-containing protein n=1 Tax=Parathielavia appendiculata TaxID=2587402 RepID=A0AAN6Z0V2_9PEZI|nr:hypothetical protein N657DRAFT_673885 [Parathielavia appendiculata]